MPFTPLIVCDVYFLYYLIIRLTGPSLGHYIMKLPFFLLQVRSINHCGRGNLGS